MEQIYLVTGIAGFIGSHIAEELLDNPNNTVIGIDNFYSGYEKNLASINSSNLIFYEGDISNDEFLKKIFINHKIQYIFHQAAVASVQKSIDDPLFSNKINVRGTLLLLDFARLNNVQRFVFASSAALYGNEPSLPKNEKSIIQPISPYGYEKLMCEQYMNLYSQMFKLETIALRYFNVYGPRQDPSSEYSGVISVFEEKFSNNECPSIFGDGNHYRDFIHVSDVVQINLCAMHHELNHKNSVFCCGTGVKISINEIFKIFCKKYNKDWSPIYKKERKGDIVGSISNNLNAMRLVGKYKMIDFREGIINL